MSEDQYKKGKKPKFVPYDEYETVVDSLAAMRVLVDLDAVAAFGECFKLLKQVAAKDAEIKRLREGVQGYVGFLQAELEYPEDDEAKMNLEMLLENVQALLSPADGDGVEEPKDENGLLPCPFCGSQDIDSEIISHRSHTIRCLNCNVVVFGENLADVMPRWNGRASQ